MSLLRPGPLGEPDVVIGDFCDWLVMLWRVFW